MCIVGRKGGLDRSETNWLQIHLSTLCVQLAATLVTKSSLDTVLLTTVTYLTQDRSGVKWAKSEHKFAAWIKKSIGLKQYSIQP